MKGTTAVAITGIGSHLARGILPMLMSDQRITRIVGIDMNKPPDLPGGKVEFKQIDIRDKKGLNDAFVGVDIVMHFAFIVNPGGLPEHEVLEICIDGSKNVFDAAADQNVKKIIYTSSVAAYGCPPAKPREPLVETDELRGSKSRWYYARAKAAVEAYLHAFVPAHPSITTTVIRPHVIVGRRYFFELLDAFINPVVEKKPFVFIKPASYTHAMMQLTHEEDLFAFIMKVVKDEVPGIFNIASDVIDFEEFNKEHGITMKFIPWWCVELLLGLAGIFSRRIRYVLQWYTALRYPPSLNCDKIKATCFAFKFPSTRDILVDAIDGKKRGARP
ncbi:MAG: NAD-dependent epimerase/dehydratase family protein [Candidatus Sigynarchaeota archaeon]